MSSDFAQFMIQFINENQAHFTDEIAHTVRPSPDPNVAPVSTDDVRQMMQGFFYLMTDALAGKDETRQFFVSTALPGLRDTGISLAEMIGGSVSLFVKIMAAASERLPRESRAQAVDWLAQFFGDYSADVARVWQGKPTG